MITNAVLLRIDRGAGGDATGQTIVTTGADLTAAPGGAPRCFLDAVSSSQRYTLGATIKDASETCYVQKTELARVGEAKPADGDRLTVQMDDGDPQTLELVAVNDRSKGSLSHFEVFLKKV